MHTPLQNSSSNWYYWLNRNRIVRVLETVQDWIAISLCIGLFSVMDPAQSNVLLAAASA